MEAMVEELSSSALLAALDANMVAFWSAYGRADGGVLHATSEVVWYYSGIPLPMFNGVLYANLGPEDVEVVARSLQALVDERHAPALVVGRAAVEARSAAPAAGAAGLAAGRRGPRHGGGPGIPR